MYRLNRDAYAKLVAEDMAWLDRQPRTLEREHIRQILTLAVEYEYGPVPGTPRTTRDLVRSELDEDEMILADRLRARVAREEKT
jgi:hypothetical protein